MEYYPVPATLQAAKSLLNDILITACEGGIGYWAELETYKWQNQETGQDLEFPVAVIVPAEDEGEEGFFRTRITVEILVSGIAALLTKDKNQARVGRLITAIVEDDAGGLDSDDCDVIIQYSMFGQIIYG